MEEREVAPVRPRHAFPLSTLLLFISVTGVIVSVIANWQTWTKQDARASAVSMDWVKWSLAAENDRTSKQIELFLIPDRNPNKWVWVVRNNTETRYNLYLGSEPVPAGQVPGRHADATLASETLYGSCLIAIECSDKSITRVVCPLGPDGHGAIALSSGSGLSFRADSDVGYVAGEDGSESHGTSGAIMLLQISPSADLKNDADGLVVWIEPIGVRPPN
jgi:hypothetical protein